MPSSTGMPLRGPAMSSDAPPAAVATEPIQSLSLESYLSNEDPSNTLNALKLLQNEVLQKGKGQADLHRLYKLYPILLDRIFGEVEIVGGNRKVESNGGWLAYSTRFMDSHNPISLQHISMLFYYRRLTLNLNRSSQNHLPHHLPNIRMRPQSSPGVVSNEGIIKVDSTGMSIQGAMLFDLLSCSNVQKYGDSERGRREANDNNNISKEQKWGKLFNVICEAPNSVQFLFPMAQLSAVSKDLIQRKPSISSMECGNSSRLFCGDCLLRRPSPQDSHLLLSMLEIYFFTLVQHAAVTHLGSMRNGTTTLVSPSRSHPSQLYKLWIKFGIQGLTRVNPYNSLLLGCYGFYFPHLQVMTGGANNAVSGGGAVTSNSVMSPSATTISAALISVGRWGVQRLERDKEVFLRVIIEFWLYQNALLSHQPHVQPVTNSLGILPNAALTAGRSVATPATTVSPFDPLETKITGEYTPPADMSLHGLLVLCTYLLADPSIKDASSKLGGAGGGGRREFGGHMSRAARAVLSPPLAILQPHVFNFLRLSFNRCPLWENFTAFALCTELWLVWLQPWLSPHIISGHPNSSATARRGGPASSSYSSSSHGITSKGGSLGNCPQPPSASSVSILTRCPCWYAHEGAFLLLPEWRAYVAGTYTFYTLLFAAFVNRARVLMAFSTDLLGFLEVCEAVTQDDSPQRLLQLGIKDHERQLLLDHRVSMSPYIGSYPHPPLSAYRDEAQMLLEELTIQSREMIATADGGGVTSELLSKTVNLISTGVTGIKHVVAGEDKCAEDYVNSSLRRIFHISQDWQPAVAQTNGLGASLNWDPAPERDCGIFLTASGRKQIALGQRACRREDVSYLGDPLLRPQESHEIPGLTSALVWLSIWLNRKFGLNSYDELQTIPEDNIGMGRVYEDEKPSNAILKAKECGISIGGKRTMSSGFSGWRLEEEPCIINPNTSTATLLLFRTAEEDEIRATNEWVEDLADLGCLEMEQEMQMKSELLDSLHGKICNAE